MGQVNLVQNDPGYCQCEKFLSNILQLVYAWLENDDCIEFNLLVSL